MPSRSELPGQLPRKKFLNALRRLGFDINTVGGKGDHVKVVWPSTQKSVTVVADLPTHQSRSGGTVRGSAPRNPVRQEATAVKPWSFTF